MRKILIWIIAVLLLVGCNANKSISICESLANDSALQTMTGYIVLNSSGQILLTRGGEDWNSRQIELIPCGEDKGNSIKKWIFSCYDSALTMHSYNKPDSVVPLVWMTVEGKYYSQDTALRYPQFNINFAALLDKSKALEKIRIENSKWRAEHK